MSWWSRLQHLTYLLLVLSCPALPVRAQSLVDPLRPWTEAPGTYAYGLALDYQLMGDAGWQLAGDEPVRYTLREHLGAISLAQSYTDARRRTWRLELGSELLLREEGWAGRVSAASFGRERTARAWARLGVAQRLGTAERWQPRLEVLYHLPSALELRLGGSWLRDPAVVMGALAYAVPVAGGTTVALEAGAGLVANEVLSLSAGFRLGLPLSPFTPPQASLSLRAGFVTDAAGSEEVAWKWTVQLSGQEVATGVGLEWRGAGP